MPGWDPVKIAFLQRYREAEWRLRDKHEQLDRLRSRLLPGAQKISDMPHGGVRSDMADAVAAIIDMENRIGAEIVALAQARDEVIRVIEAVEDGRYRALLEKRYVRLKTWETIAEELEIDPTTVWRWHGAALELVELPAEK